MAKFTSSKETDSTASTSTGADLIVKDTCLLAGPAFQHMASPLPCSTRMAGPTSSRETGFTTDGMMIKTRWMWLIPDSLETPESGGLAVSKGINGLTDKEDTLQSRSRLTCSITSNTEDAIFRCVLASL